MIAAVLTTAIRPRPGARPRVVGLVAKPGTKPGIECWGQSGAAALEWAGGDATWGVPRLRRAGAVPPARTDPMSATADMAADR